MIKKIKMIRRLREKLKLLKLLRLKKPGAGLVAGLAIILVVLLTAGWLVSQPGISPQKPPPAAPQVQLPIPPISQAQVTITGKGFVPQTILVKKGSTINWTNRDNKPHQVSSDPHPTHLLLPSLGKGQLLPAGSAYTFTFNMTGTFTYHDEQNPLKFKGTIVVK